MSDEVEAVPERCQLWKDGQQCNMVEHEMFEGEPVHVSHGHENKPGIRWIEHSTPSWTIG